MPIFQIENLSDSRIAIFTSLTEAQLRQKKDAECGIFIAESPKVINVALNAGFEPVALLCEEKHISGDAAEIIAKNPTMPVYTGKREILAQITGYTLTRGVLCAMKRSHPMTVEEICKNARRLVVIEGVVDTTNIGAIFRSAAALGMDGVLLTRNSCDPFNRRAVRVSMGSVFLIPWTWIDKPQDTLREHGFKTVAMALRNNSVRICDTILKKQEKLAVILGTEGDGLPLSTINNADFVAKIPMYHTVDSLNVAAAASIVFWELMKCDLYC